MVGLGAYSQRHNGKAIAKDIVRHKPMLHNTALQIDAKQ